MHLRQALDPGAASFLSIGLIDLPIEVIMASISGFSFQHYYMSLLPIYAVFAGFGFWLLLTQLSYPPISRKIKRMITICIAVIFFIPVVGAGIASPKIEADLQFLQSNYQIEEELGPWTVYEYAGN